MPESDDDFSAARRKRLKDRFNDDKGGSGSGAGEHDSSNEREKPAETPAADPPTRTKIQAYVDPQLAEKVRDAWWHTRNREHGFETLSDLIEAAIDEKVDALAAEYNDGEPFEPRPRKALRAGRPVRS